MPKVESAQFRVLIRHRASLVRVERTAACGSNEPVPGDAALGPREFDFRSIDPLDFEELCFALVRLEFPKAVRLAAPDMGVDILVAATDGESAHGFQAKRYVDQISWPECRQSLDAAARGHQV